jgi:hypothetical protein
MITTEKTTLWGSNINFHYINLHLINNHLSITNACQQRSQIKNFFDVRGPHKCILRATCHVYETPVLKLTIWCHFGGSKASHSVADRVRYDNIRAWLVGQNESDFARRWEPIALPRHLMVDTVRNPCYCKFWNKIRTRKRWKYQRNHNGVISTTTWTKRNFWRNFFHFLYFLKTH